MFTAYQITRQTSLCLPLDDAGSLLICLRLNPLDETVAQECIIEAEPLEMLYMIRKHFAIPGLNVFLFVSLFIFIDTVHQRGT